ncbi:hypothetical protein EYF80_019562 [Liparis tanakae]|uniref:Uncharacterized protein n=1 Tax=Liparis tanakae TaxID=230148 RepID=A0A4Z2HX97_9TELE|nr:hypothetical protein EYF80_019562 [Liparis tanakae]
MFILHLKRFSSTLLLRPQKLNDPIDVLRELIVTSGQAVKTRDTGFRRDDELDVPQSNRK